MFNFGDALTYIFKEKQWGWKLALPLLFYVFIVVPSTIITFLNYSSNNLAYSSIYAPSSYNDGSFFLSFGLTCFMLIAVIPYIVISIWYMYENTQSGIFHRHTKAIWENNTKDTVKKTGKYLLVNMIYNIFTAALIILMSLVFVLLGVIFSLFGITVVQNLMASQGSMSSFIGTWVMLLLICGFSALFVGVILHMYLWMTTGSLRLIATNSFSEALKFRENWHIGWRYKWHFFGLIGLLFIFGLVVGSAGSMVSLFTYALTASYPTFGLLVDLGVEIFAAIFFTYVVLFVYPRLLGQLFRGIIKREKVLSFIKL